MYKMNAASIGRLIVSLRCFSRLRSSLHKIPVYQGSPTLLVERTLTGYSKRQFSQDMSNKNNIVSYEELLEAINKPQKVLVDVREPDELKETGRIPSSINIPLSSVESTLSMPDEEFKNLYGLKKPNQSSEIIFYCMSGKRSGMALDKAQKLGYTNAKNYQGSWLEWSSKQPQK